MPNIGFPELVVILMIFVLVFGASRLPQIGEGLGKAIKNLKQGLASDDSIEVADAPDKPAESEPAPKAPTSATEGEGIADAELVDKS